MELMIAIAHTRRAREAKIFVIENGPKFSQPFHCHMSCGIQWWQIWGFACCSWEGGGGLRSPKAEKIAAELR